MTSRLSDLTRVFTTGGDGSSPSVEYRGLFVEPGGARSDRCILVLSGTSIQLEDLEFFINHLVDKGHPVASIERNIGGLVDLKTESQRDRKLALRHFVHYLTGTGGISRIDVIAQSYAAFEVVRLLVEDPESYKAHISGVVLVNPAGFDEHIRYLPHCLRFLFIHVLSAYASALKGLLLRGRLGSGPTPDFRRKLRAVHSFFIKTIRNPIRTFKEISDIVSFDIIPYMKLLIDKYGYSFYFVLSCNDNLVSARDTLGWSRRLVPDENITVFPGNHLDPFIDGRQVEYLMNSMETLACRGQHA